MNSFLKASDGLEDLWWSSRTVTTGLQSSCCWGGKTKPRPGNLAENLPR